MNRPWKHSSFEMAASEDMLKLTETPDRNFQIHELFESPTCMGIHEKKHVAYNQRMQNLCKFPSIKTTNFGLESLTFEGSCLWNTLDII